MIDSEFLADVREHLNYCPDTGRFNWKVATGRGRSRRRPDGLAGGFNSYGYWEVRVFGKLYRAHRLAWLMVHGKWPDEDIDHINGDRADNRIINLRDVSRADNLHNNTKLHPSNTSGMSGVFPHRLRWGSKISIDNKNVHLGIFNTKELAYRAYLNAKANRLIDKPFTNKESKCPSSYRISTLVLSVKPAQPLPANQHFVTINSRPYVPSWRRPKSHIA